MKICFVTFQYPPMIRGGVGTATYRIAKNLVNAGVQIHVIAPGNNRVDAQILPSVEDGIVVHRLFPSLGNYLQANPLELKEATEYVISLNDEVKFDLVHGFFIFPSGFVASWAAEAIKCPLVLSIRGNDIELLRFSPVYLGTLKWVLQNATFVTSVTSELLEIAKKIVSLPFSQVIDNAVDVSMFESDALSEIIKKQNLRYRLFFQKFKKIKEGSTPMIGTSGLIRHKKGFNHLLEAFKDLLVTYPRAHLLLVGGFTSQYDEAITKQQIKYLKLKKKVTITGPVPHAHVSAWLKELDIFAFPSLYEGSPNALLEAMGIGLPIVASRIDGIKGVIKDKENGFLVSPGSSEALAQRLELLAQNTQLRQKLATAALKTIEEDFSAERESTTWLDIYYRTQEIYQTTECVDDSK